MTDVRSFGSSVLAASVGALLVVVGLFIYGHAIGQDTTHEDLLARMERIEQNQAVIICLLTEQGSFAECLALGPLD
jgi:hypothetical protein